MRKPDWVLVACSVAVALVIAYATIGTAQAETAKPAKKCLAVADLSGNIIVNGGSVTPLAAAGFAKATKILRGMPRGQGVEADAAFFDEMPDGSSGILFAKGACATALWLTPPFLSKGKLKALLLGPDKPANSEREWL